MKEVNIPSFIGIYENRSSIFNKLNTFTKFGILLFIGLLELLEREFLFVLIYIGIIFIFSILSKFKIKDYLRVFRTAKIFIFITLMTAFLRPSFTYWFKFYFITVSADNIMYLLSMCLKTLGIITLVYIFTSTTPLIEILKTWSSLENEKNARNKMIRIFKIDRLLIICILTLSFIPFILEEFNSIFRETSNIDSKNVQRDKKRNFKWLLKILPILITNLINKADDFSKYGNL